MHDYQENLGKAVKNARTELNLSQHQLAEMLEIDVRTIIGIENFRSNPQLKILYPLIRTLKIDAREVFSPETYTESPTFRKIHQLISECSEKEAAALLQIIEAVLTTLRSPDTTEMK